MREESNGRQCRVVKNHNYTTISNICLRTKTMSLKAKGLLTVCLSLPDDWDYSIAGLVTLSKDGRDSVTKALEELEKHGFLVIENSRIKGAFARFYTFYENPEENPNYKMKSPENSDFHRNGFSVTVNPMQLCRNGSAVTENPEQINTNNKVLKLNTKTNEQMSLLKTEDSVFNEIDLFNLYKEICIHFSQPKKLTNSRKEKSKKRLSENPQKEFWEVVFRNAEKSVFIRKSSFFSFDWVLANDINALKVYEGKYNKQEISNENVASGVQGSKYSRCYNG